MLQNKSNIKSDIKLILLPGILEDLILILEMVNKRPIEG